MISNEANIKILIDECLRSNELAQDQMFTLHYSFVMSICRRYAHNKEDASEMLNDCFYRVFKNLDKYDSSFPFLPWLRKVCVNCCLRYLEKYKAKIRYEDWDDRFIDQKYEDIYLPEIKDKNYLKLLEGLPPACKTIINLYVIEGYKHSEIAEMLNISVGTSKSNLHRAKNLLYEMLERAGRGRLKKKIES